MPLHVMPLGKFPCIFVILEPLYILSTLILIPIPCSENRITPDAVE